MNKNNLEKELFLGVDYYPEQWSSKMIEEDLSLMVSSKVNYIRIAEFAWHLMEPKEGKFSFDYFKHILDRAHHYGLKVMLGTPTATMPAWLVRKHPDVLSVDYNQQVRAFGGRRQACLNAPAYLKAASAIVYQMAKAYGEHPAVNAWQIDNELGHESSDECYCHHCKKAFQHYLLEVFNHDIQSFNEAIGSVFWSQSYNSFDEVSLPLKTIPAMNPGLQIYFKRFRSYTIKKYIQMQVAILRPLISLSSITHNFTGDYFSKSQDHTELAAPLDVVSLNNYPVWGGLSKPVSPHKLAMKLDQTRGFLKKNFWITEQIIGAQAHTIMGYVPRPNQARLWSWQALAHGCDRLIYFRWRTAVKGAEQFCYGVLGHDNKQGKRYQEMLTVFDEADHYKDFLMGAMHAEVALIYDMDNIYSWQIQPQSEKMDAQDEHARLYQGFYNCNVPVDVIDIKHDFSHYKVLLLPIPLLIEDEDMIRLRSFVERGGQVVFSFRAGLKKYHNEIRFAEVNPVLSLAGVEAEYFEALNEKGCQIRLNDGTLNQGAVWRDMLVISDEKTELLAYYEGEFSEYGAVSYRAIGDGAVYYVGSGIEDVQFWNKLSSKILSDVEIVHNLTQEGVECVVRENDKGEKLCIIMNHNDKCSSYMDLDLEPYEVRFIRG